MKTLTPPKSIRTKKLPPVGKSPFSATFLCLRHILATVWAGSQAALHKDTSIDQGIVYRLFTGERAPTPDSIGKVIRGLPTKHKALALTLIETYLQDIADQAHDGYVAVHVKKA